MVGSWLAVLGSSLLAAAPTEAPAPTPESPAPAEATPPAPTEATPPAPTEATPPAPTEATPPAPTEAPPPTSIDTPAPTATLDPAVPEAAPTPGPAPPERFTLPTAPEPEPAPPEPAGTEWGPEDVVPPRPPVVVRTDDGYAMVAIGNPKPMPPIAPDLTIRKWKRNAGVMMGIGAATYLGAVAMQGIRLAGMAACEDKDTPQLVHNCQSTLGVTTDPTLGVYTVAFHSMAVGAGGGAGAMLGRARATEDVQIHGHWAPKPLATGLGLALAIGNGLVYITSGLALTARQSNADDPASVQRRRFLVMDATAIMTAFGAGLAGYGLAYGKHAKTLSKIHLGASIGPGFNGLSASGKF